MAFYGRRHQRGTQINKIPNKPQQPTQTFPCGHRPWHIAKGFSLAMFYKLTAPAAHPFAVSHAVAGLLRFKFDFADSPPLKSDLNSSPPCIFLLIARARARIQVTMKRALRNRPRDSILARTVRIARCAKRRISRFRHVRKIPVAVAGDYYDAFYPLYTFRGNEKLFSCDRGTLPERCPPALLMATFQPSSAPSPAKVSPLRLRRAPQSLRHGAPSTAARFTARPSRRIRTHHSSSRIRQRQATTIRFLRSKTAASNVSEIGGVPLGH